jgi:hypothetical protein
LSADYAALVYRSRASLYERALGFRLVASRCWCEQECSVGLQTAPLLPSNGLRLANRGLSLGERTSRARPLPLPTPWHHQLAIRVPAPVVATPRGSPRPHPVFVCETHRASIRRPTHSPRLCPRVPRRLSVTRLRGASGAMRTRVPRAVQGVPGDSFVALHAPLAQSKTPTDTALALGFCSSLLRGGRIPPDMVATLGRGGGGGDHTSSNLPRHAASAARAAAGTRWG